MCELGSEVTMEVQLSRSEFHLRSHDVAYFTQAFLNRFGGFVVTTTIDVKLVV